VYLSPYKGRPILNRILWVNPNPLRNNLDMYLAILYAMHVLIIAQYYPPDLGGASTRANNIAKGLKKNGVKITIVSAYPHYPHGKIPSEYGTKFFIQTQHDGTTLIRTFMIPLESKGLVNRLFTFMTFALSSLVGLFFIKKVDIIWSANPNIFSLIPALIYKLKYRCPIVFNVDDIQIEDMRNLNILKENSFIYHVARILTIFLYNQVDAVTPISPGYIDKIREFGIPKEKIYLVRGGVDLEIFRPHPIKNTTFRVAYSGSFSITYDFRQVINAAELLTEYPIEFIFQGSGELLNEIKYLIKKKRLRNIKIMNVILSRIEVSEFLNQANILILPLKDFGVPYTGISSKLYEFQAVGKPIICCSIGEPSKYVKDTKSGIIVKPRDVQALANAIITLYENPEKAREMGEMGRKYVENNVSIEKIGYLMKNILLKVKEEYKTISS